MEENEKRRNVELAYLSLMLSGKKVSECELASEVLKISRAKGEKSLAMLVQSSIKITRRGLSRQRRTRAWPITHSLNSLPRSVTKTCSKIPLYAMSFLPGAVTQKRFATVMPVPCQTMVRTVFVLPARRERTLFISRLSKVVALANRAIGMSNTK